MTKWTKVAPLAGGAPTSLDDVGIIGHRRILFKNRRVVIRRGFHNIVQIQAERMFASPARWAHNMNSTPVVAIMSENFHGYKFLGSWAASRHR